MRGAHHPDQFAFDPAKYKEAEDMFKRIGLMWDKAQQYGAIADIRA